jgi:iron complex outermembrane receptor protein
MEAGLHFHPVSLPWLHIQGTYSSVTGKQENGDYLPFIPAHKFRYEIRADIKKTGILNKSAIKVSALTALKQDDPSPFETETDGYTLISLSLNSDIIVYKQTLVFGISVNNLFDTKYYDHLSTLKPLNYYNQGRNILVSVEMPINIK